MADDILDYEPIVEESLRGVVRKALAIVERRGLPGGHHFYIGFRTGDPGVAVPDDLRARYPGEMTIVLQHQFSGLAVEDHRFRVTLRFNGVPRALTVPFAAITSFADPEANFALQFRAGARPAEAPEAAPGEAEDRTAAAEETGGAAEKVVTLDAFRKKT